jgi:hypothetical protein
MRLDAGAIKGFKSAEEVNALMRAADGWSPAWMRSSTVAQVTVKPGTTVRMVVDKQTYDALTDISGMADTSRAFGGWATFDDVPNAAYARNKFAITSEMKSINSSLYVVDVQVAKPINAQVGVVGAQRSATGGGDQLHFLVPPADRSSIFKFIVGSGRPLL